MLTNDEIYGLAREAVKEMFRQHGRDFCFPFDLIWQFAQTSNDILSTMRPHQARPLLAKGYIAKTGKTIRAASTKRAGSPTSEYCFGPALLEGGMTFIVLDDKRKFAPDKDDFPIVTLKKENWDDFGYKTRYLAAIWLNPTDAINLGEVKILHGTTVADQEKLPHRFFANHKTTAFCSLGQDLEYYKNVLQLDTDLRDQYLRGMNDIVFNPTIKTRFQGNPGFKLSLVRFASAIQALADGPQLLGVPHSINPSELCDGPHFVFRTKLAKDADDLDIDFDFRSVEGIPNKLNIVIGYNGTGKTQLISNLATVISGYGYKTKADLLKKGVGEFVGVAPTFGGVIVISYSAFDTFKIPGTDKIEKEQITSKGGIFGYIYCGLRQLLTIEGNDARYGLKNHDEIKKDYENAMVRINSSPERKEIFLKVFQLLAVEASFQRIDFNQNDDVFINFDFFSLLSTGHKIALIIVTQLTAFLDKEKRMLVIMDEPEAHLHPPLLAALLHSIRMCLSYFDAHAIIATHSPVVLQETPARFIRILRRINNFSEVVMPTIETFGENIGVITQEIFNLDDSATDWHKILGVLAENNSLDEIERKFGRRLGFSARSYVMSLIDER